MAAKRAALYAATALLIYLAARLFPAVAGLSDTGQPVLGVVVAGVLLWVSEALPLGLTALFLLALLGTVPAATGSGTRGAYCLRCDARQVAACR